LAQSRQGRAHTAAQRLGQASTSALAYGYDRIVAKRRYTEQGACSLGDSVVACDIFLAYEEGHEALRPRSLHRRNGDFSMACRQMPRAYAFSPPESSSTSLAAAVLNLEIKRKFASDSTCGMCMRRCGIRKQGAPGYLAVPDRCESCCFLQSDFDNAAFTLVTLALPVGDRRVRRCARAEP
jgi:hypothetical protein